MILTEIVVSAKMGLVSIKMKVPRNYFVKQIGRLLNLANFVEMAKEKYQKINLGFL
jgi:hypothetical protein